MNRRLFLGVMGAGIATLAGCAAPGTTPDTGDRNQPIVDRQFTLVDSEERFGSGSYDPDERFRHATDVRFEAQSDRVVVVGRLKSGGRSCKETVLESATYDEASDTLTVVVFDDHDESATACTAEITVVPYEVIVTFDSMLPEEVVVKHRADRSGIVFTEKYERE